MGSLVGVGDAREIFQMTLKAHPLNVVAVVVTFNPGNVQLLFERLEVLANEVGLVVVSDNSDSLEIANKIRSFLESQKNSLYLGNGVNHGIGHAQNLAFFHEKASQYSHVVTFDQDSCFRRGFVTALCDIYNTNVAGNEYLGCLGPRLFNGRTGRFYTAYTDGKRLINEHICATEVLASSGMLIPREVLQIVGGMRDGWFIDLLDVEWCYRVRSKGFQVAVALPVDMEHTFGEKDFKVPFRGPVVIPAPRRMYYIARNTLLMSRLSYIPVSFRLNQVLSLPLKLMIYIASGDSFRRIRLFALGLWDGVRGKAPLRKL